MSELVLLDLKQSVVWEKNNSDWAGLTLGLRLKVALVPLRLFTAKWHLSLNGENVPVFSCCVSGYQNQTGTRDLTAFYFRLCYDNDYA